MPKPTRSQSWRLCRSGPNGWTGGYSSPLLDGWDDLERAEEALGLHEGQPFLLRPDGTADADVLAYLASPTFRRLSTGSRGSYAMDLKVFLTFLEHVGTDWRLATYDTLLDYEYWRRKDPANPRRISGAKFARELAACTGFYRWQVSRGTVSANPVVMVSERSRAGEIRERAALQPRNVRSVKVKWLTPRAYRRWRDVGLGGYGADGLPDDSWRGRNDGRNMAMSDLMWDSGLRLREAGTLTLAEVPTSSGTENYVKGRMSESVAKGAAREYWVSRRALQRIDAYVRTTRASAVRRAQREGRYDEVDGQLIVTSISARGDLTCEDARGRASRIHVDQLDSEERRRLFRRVGEDVEPMSLWLTESGMPMPYLSWEAVFSAASARCQSLGVGITCHPHMLRHSFALRMLVTLTYVFDRRMGLSESERLEYRHLFGDPWVLVQTMLGHSKLSTTRSYYLEPVQGLQVDLFLNEGGEEDSMEGLVEKVARMSPLVRDLPVTP